MKRIAVVMAGGSGERFWPLSRAHRPKQMLRLSDPDKTMLEEAAARLLPLVGKDGLYISTSRPLQQTIVKSGVATSDRVLAEPLKRNTLGALVWVAASLLADEFEPETLIAIVTADHRISTTEQFGQCVEEAFALATRERGLVTIGIKPTRPETGFGYIETEATSSRAKSFREKPDAATAQQFLDSGRFLWNSGMFFFTLGAFLSEVEKAQPGLGGLVEAIGGALREEQEASAVALFDTVPNASFDVAVMEKSENVFAIPSTFEWDDLGSWDALERSMPTDDSGSVIEGNAVVIDCENCIVYNDDPRAVVSLLGVKDLIVVCTTDAVLVCPKNEAQRVKEVVQALQGGGKT